MQQITLRLDNLGRLYSDGKLIETNTDNVCYSVAETPKTLYFNTANRTAMFFYDRQGVFLSRINGELKVYRDGLDEALLTPYKPVEYDWRLISVDLADKFNQGEEVDALLINYYLAEAKESLENTLQVDADAELINHLKDMPGIDMKVLEAYVDMKLTIEALEDAIVLTVG